MLTDSRVAAANPAKSFLGSADRPLGAVSLVKAAVTRIERRLDPELFVTTSLGPDSCTLHFMADCIANDLVGVQAMQRAGTVAMNESVMGR